MDWVWLVVALCWTAGAVGLFFRSHLGWCGSLLGVSFMFAGSVAVIAMTIIVKPEAPGGAAAVLGLIGAVLSFLLFVGILRQRKTLKPR